MGEHQLFLDRMVSRLRSTSKCFYTKHLDKVLEEAAAESYPHIKFLRVECPKYPGFCITRQRKEYPFIEVFHSPEQAAIQGKVVDPNITKYSVKMLPGNWTNFKNCFTLQIWDSRNNTIAAFTIIFCKQILYPIYKYKLTLISLTSVQEIPNLGTWEYAAEGILGILEDAVGQGGDWDGFETGWGFLDDLS